MGIAIHNVAASLPGHEDTSLDLTAALRQEASGILGTTVQLADLVRGSVCFEGDDRLTRRYVHQVIPFVAGGFMYIGAVAVLPT